MFDDGVLEGVRTLSEVGYKAFCVRLPIANITVWQLAVALVLFESIIYVYEKIVNKDKTSVGLDNNNHKVYEFDNGNLRSIR